MDQQPNYQRRRLAFATAAIALLALTNRPDPMPKIGVIRISASNDGPVRMTAETKPFIAGVAMLANWATDHLTR